MEFSGGTDAKCVVLGVSGLEEIRDSYNTSRGFPWENGLCFLRFSLEQLAKERKVWDSLGLCPGE